MDDAHTQPRILNLPERITLARALHRHGLGHLQLPGLTVDTPPCLGKQFCCACPDCTADPSEAVAQPAQPWEARAPRRAA